MYLYQYILSYKFNIGIPNYKKHKFAQQNKIMVKTNNY